MRTWDLPLDLDPAQDLPLFLQISRGITDRVKGGQLKPGDALPGSRTLATLLGVHRNTVLAAYRELGAQGWTTSRPAGATFVSASLPEVDGLAFAEPQPVSDRAGFDFDVPAVLPEAWPRTAPPGVLSLGGGSPDVRLIPAEALARAARRAMRRRKGAALDYGDPRGHSGLLTSLSAMLGALRGVRATPENLLVTRGSQMALDLVARVVVKPGDVVAVEEWGYPPAWSVLEMRGARLVPIRVDQDGLDVDALSAIPDLRAVYLTPHHQYPTTVALSPARRLRLLDLARRRRFAILEDDYDHEFHYEGRPLLPLASADRHGVVVYVGTLSKILAPGLRLGFVVGPEKLVDALVRLRHVTDRQGDHVMDAAVAELIDDGELQRHARRMRRVYGARREALADALRKRLPVVDFELPRGGMAFWARVNPAVDVDAWARRALNHKVAIRTGTQFRYDQCPANHVRLAFASHTESELDEAVQRLARAL